MYKDEFGNFKGDALIGYAKIESVALALENLHDSEIRSGLKIRVERVRFNRQAEFKQKGEQYIPRQIAKIDKLEKIRIKAEMERQMTWCEEDDFKMGLKIVILKNMFSQEEVENEVK